LLVKEYEDFYKEVFSEKTNLREVSVRRIKEIEELLKNRPIRNFNYGHPIKVLNNKCVTYGVGHGVYFKS
jgi:IS30 family transposase